MDKLYGQPQEGRHSYNNFKRTPKEYNYDADEMVAVKIRGMPYNTRYEEVAKFFNG